jgi:hypothetical protein
MSDLNEAGGAPGASSEAEGGAEVEALASLAKKLKLIDDRVAAVVGGYSTGLYLFGAGGLGKSYSVLKKLSELGADYRTFNSRMTAKGLFLALEKAPDAIHVLEDMERLTNDRDAQGVLRSALWSQADRERTVTWTTSEGERKVAFRGGIIMLANRQLSDLPELRALATRITVHRMEITYQEMVALMRSISGKGWSRYQHKLGADECLAVCEYVIAQCQAAGCELDLRLLDNSCLDYCQWESDNSSCDWRDLVANRVRQHAAHFRHEIATLTRDERLARDREIARDICARSDDPQERLRLWKEATGKGHNAFYKRKRECEDSEFDVG